VPDDRDETPDERADRNMAELLQELRVALPGVQVLFAFLLTVPFAQGFASATDFQRTIYLVTLLASTCASAFFISPTAYHRLNFRRRDKQHIVEISSRLTVLGILSLAVAMTGAILLVTDYLFKAGTTLIVTVGVGLLLATMWAFLPMLRRRKTDKRDAVQD
jgi:cation transport ATPase